MNDAQLRAVLAWFAPQTDDRGVFAEEYVGNWLAQIIRRPEVVDGLLPALKEFALSRALQAKARAVLKRADDRVDRACDRVNAAVAGEPPRNKALSVRDALNGQARRSRR